MTRYLVTGGAGFIGSHLSELLVERGEQVVVLDDLSTGCHANIARLAGRRGFRFVRRSAADARLVERLVVSSDVTVHLAAAVGVELIRDQPLPSLLTNVSTTEAVLRAAARHGRAVLIASSSEVYGTSPCVPSVEDADRNVGAAWDMRSTYAAAKALDESLAAAYARQAGLRVVVVRLFNTTGPRQRPDYGMVVPRFVRDALAGRPLRVFGDGRQTRCFAHVVDVAGALHSLITHPAAAGNVYNVGSQEEVSILELAERVVEATGARVPVLLVPAREGCPEARRRVPSLKKIRAAVGWAPEHDLDAIIRDVIDHHRVGAFRSGVAI